MSDGRVRSTGGCCLAPRWRAHLRRDLRLAMDEVSSSFICCAANGACAVCGDSSVAFAVWSRACSTWQGLDARGGAPHAAVDKAEPEDSEMTEAKPAVSSTAGFFSAASHTAGGGRRGADLARALQRWLITYVEGLPLDEIELMAGAGMEAKTEAS